MINPMFPSAEVDGRVFQEFDGAGKFSQELTNRAIQEWVKGRWKRKLKRFLRMK